jgi:small neutral amino acid transporter SnatA (MarC family)
VTRLALALLAAVNPAAVAATLRGAVAARAVALAAAVAWVVAVALAVASDEVLDLLDVSAPTFRLGAAVVLGAASLRWLVGGPPHLDGDDVGAAAAALPAVVTPQLAVVSIAMGADEGVVPVAVAGAVALALSWAAWRVGGGRKAWSWAARLVAGAGTVVAIALAVDALQTV